MVHFLAQFRLSFFGWIILFFTISFSQLHGSDAASLTVKAVPAPIEASKTDCHFLLRYFFGNEIKGDAGIAKVAHLIGKVPKELQYRISSCLSDWLIGCTVMEKPSREITAEYFLEECPLEFIDDSHIMGFGREDRSPTTTMIDSSQRDSSLGTRAHVIPFSPASLQGVLSPALYEEMNRAFLSHEKLAWRVDGYCVLDLSKEFATSAILYPPESWSHGRHDFFRMSSDGKQLGCINSNVFVIFKLDNFHITEGHRVRFFDVDNEPVESFDYKIKIPTNNCKSPEDFDYIEDFRFLPDGSLTILTAGMKRYRVELPPLGTDENGAAHLVLLNAHSTFKNEKVERAGRTVISAIMGERGAFFRLNTGIRDGGCTPHLQNFVWWNYEDNTLTQFAQDDDEWKLSNDGWPASIKNDHIAIWSRGTAWLTEKRLLKCRKNHYSDREYREIKRTYNRYKIVIFNSATKRATVLFTKVSGLKHISLSSDCCFLSIVYKRGFQIYHLPSQKCIVHSEAIRFSSTQPSSVFNSSCTGLATLTNEHTIHLWNIALLREMLPLYHGKLTLMQSLFILFLRDLKRQNLPFREALPSLAEKYRLSQEDIIFSLGIIFKSFNDSLKKYALLVAGTAFSHESE